MSPLDSRVFDVVISLRHKICQASADMECHENKAEGGISEQEDRVCRLNISASTTTTVYSSLFLGASSPRMLLGGDAVVSQTLVRGAGSAGN